eukprot:m.135637 g.135637  ORF g.135637 m.135637 type:complete len:51 (-) comp10102_c0_seq1:44-196(-)
MNMKEQDCEFGLNFCTLFIVMELISVPLDHHLIISLSVTTPTYVIFVCCY